LDILSIQQYDMVKPLFAGIPGCLWHIASMERKRLGAIYVDNLVHPQTVFFETPYFFYYFGGLFDEAFLNEAVGHVAKDMVPEGETRPAFFLSTDQSWKGALELRLAAYCQPDFGAYLTRRLYHLNPAKYHAVREAFILPKGYHAQLHEEKGELRAVINSGSEMVCHCGDGGQGLGFMDFDVFTHPDHRRRGLAEYCCAMLIDDCIERDITPQWGCWSVNEPSCKLAEKLGFDLGAEAQTNLALIDKQNKEDSV